MSPKLECYFGNVPNQFKSKFIELYKTPYCTIEYQQSFCDENALNCVSIHDDDKLIHLILFTINKQHRTVAILNRVFELDPKYLSLFSDYIFNSEKNIDKIKVNHLTKSHLSKKSIPYICRPFDEDYILKLPVSNSEYLSRLSPNMRRHTKNYISKIERTFGHYSFCLFEKEEATEEIIDRIIEMNHLRMNAKNIVSGIDQLYTEKIKRFVRYFGFVSVLKLNGEIIAGLISYSIKNNYFVEEISSDPKYDAYNVGHTCLFHTIQNCIDRNGNEFHLLWGNSPYKKRFLAERMQLYSVTVFRSELIKLKFRLTNEILPCLSTKYIFRIIKCKIKNILGQKVIDNLRNQRII